jgi:hypothetical protein
MQSVVDHDRTGSRDRRDQPQTVVEQREDVIWCRMGCPGGGEGAQTRRRSSAGERRETCALGGALGDQDRRGAGARRPPRDRQGDRRGSCAANEAAYGDERATRAIECEWTIRARAPS